MSSACVVGAGVFGASTRARAGAARLGCDPRRAVHAGHRPVGIGRRHAAAARRARRRRVVHGKSHYAPARSGSSSNRRRRPGSGKASAWRGSRGAPTGSRPRASPFWNASGSRTSGCRPTTRAGSSRRSPSTICTACCTSLTPGVLHARRATQLLVSEGERHGVTMQGRAIRTVRRSARRRRRLGLRRVAAAALPRARRDRRLPARRLLPRRRPRVARRPRVRRLRRRVLRARRRRQGSASRSPPTRRTTRSTPTRSTACRRPTGKSRRASYAARRFPSLAERAGARRSRLPVRPLARHALRRRPPPRARSLVARRRWLGARLQARPRARRVRRRLHRGHSENAEAFHALGARTGDAGLRTGST